MAERKKQSVLNGALVLALAMLAVKVIGVLFKMPLTNTLGMVGRGFFDTAYNIYVPVFAISMAGLPVAIARMVAEDVALGRYRNARRVFTVGKVMYLIIGIAGTLLLALAALPYAAWFIKDLRNLPTVLAIAPSIFFCCYMSAYRGYYEGLRNMTPTAVSQCIEAAGKLVIGLALAKFIFSAGQSQYDAAVLAGEQTIRIFGFLVQDAKEAASTISACAAAGAVFGVTCGSFISMVYLMLFHKLRGDKFTRTELANAPRSATNGVIAKRLLVIAMPMMASALILNVTNLIDTLTIQGRILTALEKDFTTVYTMFQTAFDAAVQNGNLNLSKLEEVRTYLWGAYGAALDFRTLVPTIVSSLGISALPALSEAWALKNRKSAKQTINMVMRFCMLIALPAGVGMAVLAEPIMTMIYGDGKGAEAIYIMAKIMQVYGVCTAFMAVSTPVTNMLQAIGRADIPLYSMLVAAAVKVTCNFIFVGNPNFTIYGAVIGTVLFYLIVVCFNLFSLLRITKIRLHLSSVVLKPLVSSLLCGLAAWAGYGFASRLFSSATIATALAVGMAGLVYASSLLLLRGILKEDVKSLPMGENIAKALEKYSLLG